MAELGSGSILRLSGAHYEDRSVPLNFPMGVFGRVDELVQWLPERHEQRTGVRLVTGQLRAVLDRLVAAL